MFLLILVMVMLFAGQQTTSFTVKLGTEFSANDNTTNSLFGYDVAMNNEYTVVAAPYDSSVFIYEFDPSNNSWTQTQKIYPMGIDFRFYKRKYL